MGAELAQPESPPVAEPGNPAADDPYALVNAALARLAAAPSDEEALIVGIRGYLRLGLAEPARELLNACPELVARRPDLADLRRQLARCPSGRVNWQSLRGQFERNAGLLYRRYPQYRSLDETFRSVANAFVLYRTSDANWQLRRRASRGPGYWVPDVFDARGYVARALLPHHPGDPTCGAYLVFADRYALLFDRVFAATQNVFLAYSPRIYVVEPDPLAFGVVLHTYDDFERLCHERVMLLVGPNAVAQLYRLLVEQVHLPVPVHAVTLPPLHRELHASIRLALKTAGAQRDRRTRVVIAATRDYYASLPAGYWKRRFAPDRDRPLRVLGIASRHTTVLQHSMRRLQAAFERAGHQFRLFIESSDYDPLSGHLLAAEIENWRPDLVFSIDHLRSEHSCLVPENLPWVCWIQDYLPALTCREAGQSLGPLDFYIAFECDDLVRHYGYPPDRGLTWTLATDPHLYDAEPLPESELAPYRCDFSFVSNSSRVPEEFHRQQQDLDGQDDLARRLRDCVFQMLRRELQSSPRTAFQRAAHYVLEEARRQTGIELADGKVATLFAQTYLHPMADLLFRQQALEWVADFCDRTGLTLHLYGRGWENHPRFARHARGIASGGRELRAIYQASRINLQIMAFGSVHPRLLDGLAAGGFFLIRYSALDVLHGPVRRLLAAVDRYGIEPDRHYAARAVPEFAAALRELASLRGEPLPGEQVFIAAAELGRFREMAADGFRRCAGAVFPQYSEITFASAEEFGALATRYLSDGQARASITSAMRQAVLARFTYDALVRDLLDFLHRTLP